MVMATPEASIASAFHAKGQRSRGRKSRRGQLLADKPDRDPDDGVVAALMGERSPAWALADRSCVAIRRSERAAMEDKMRVGVLIAPSSSAERGGDSRAWQKLAALLGALRDRDRLLKAHGRSSEIAERLRRASVKRPRYALT
jgi:hypothetical protein